MGAVLHGVLSAFKHGYWNIGFVRQPDYQDFVLRGKPEATDKKGQPYGWPD
ncbi:hypothetical protein [Marinobacter changyiensis]|uniref:hypothetical protein n=1 Tax=Marinobacter changyiensis TaxID=2604091 RepID=UPI0015D164E6|nr:hypothetical protein [Marinobacter changyiensis]